MKKNMKKLFLLMVVVMTAMVCFAFSASAETWGDYGYYIMDDGNVSITNYTGGTANLVIPSTIDGKAVTRIAANAFGYNDSIKSIEIPDSVTFIGERAFAFSNYIETVTIGSGVSEIEKTAFGYCYQLKKIIVDKNNKYFSSSSDGVLFNKDKTKLIQYNINSDRASYTVPNSVTSIGDNAFMDADNLETITVPSSVNDIGQAAFYHCKVLEKVNVKGKIGEIKYETFAYCENLVTVNISECSSIGVNAFYYCTSLSDIKIPETVTSIGNGAFQGCESLSSLKIPDSVTEIDSSAFQRAGLTAVTISENITELKSYTFADTKLKNVAIPKNVTTIDYMAFDACAQLESINVSSENKYYKSENGILYTKDMKELTAFPKNSPLVNYSIPYGVEKAYYLYSNNIVSLTIPASLKSMEGCDGEKLKEIKVNADNSTYCAVNGVLFNKDKTELLKYPSAKTETEYTVPEGVKIIGGSAFSGCNNLKNIIISDGVETIEGYAFYNSNSIESIIVPKSVTYFSGDGFSYEIENIYYRGSKEQWSSIDKGFWNVFPNEIVHYNYAHDHFHNYKTKVTAKATLTANGKVVTKCSVCGEIKSTSTVYYPKTITLSKTSYTYNGKEQKPAVTVKDSKGNTLKNGTDYTVTYASGRTLPGKYTVKVAFKGNYSGTKSLTYTIAFKAPANVKTTQSASAIKLTWDKVAGADGYRVYMYNTSTKKWVNQKTLTATSYTVKKLKANTTYQFKIIAYKKVNGTAIWGNYTSVIKATTKLPAPTGIKIAQNESAIKLTWNKVAGASGYRVYMYNASTKKWVNQKTLTATSLMIKNLKAGTTYQFKIIAYKKVNGTAVWGDYTAVFKASTRTATPKITAVASTAKKRVAVAWSDVVGETGYELWASTKKDSGYKKVVTAKANATKGIRTDLTSGKTYYFKVRSYKTVDGARVYSAWSAVKSVKIK